MSYKDKLVKTSDKIRNDLNAKLHGKTYTFNLPTFQGFGGGSFGGAGAGGDWKEYPNNYVELPQYERRTPIITKESFSQAFNRARIKGDPTFEFNGKIYTTEISDNPQYIGKRYQDKTSAVLREVLDDKMKVMSDSTRVEPFIGQLLGIRKRDESEYKYLDGGVLFGKSGIHIKKKNIGSFTRYCGGNVTQECIERGKNSPSAAIRKKSVFADNARHWKHKNGGILKAQEGTGNGFWSKLWNAVKEGGMAARDAKIGAIGAQQVRDLYSEGKNQEAQDLAKQYAKANTTGIALAGGVASTGLLGDLMVTGATTAADTFIDGDVENFGKNLSLNTAFDLAGHGAGKLLKNVDWSKVRNGVELIPDTKANVSEYINTIDDALPERQPLTTNKSAVWSNTSESKLTEAERLGIPKGQRSNPKALDDSQYWGYEQWNERYNAAIQSGNKEEVQRLRDLHFKIKAPDTKFVTNDGFPQHNYHGGQKGITVFLNAKDNPNYHQTRHQGYSHPETRSGIYFSEYMDTAKNYKYRKDGEIYDVYLNASRPYKQTYTTTLMNRFKNLNPFQRYFDPAIIRNIDLETTLKDFDSVKHSDAENVVWDGKRIKLANGITYDDSGNIVPIVKRDNFRNVDSRYQQGGKI